jgi:hypothetical protein
VAAHRCRNRLRATAGTGTVQLGVSTERIRPRDQPRTPSWRPETPLQSLYLAHHADHDTSRGRADWKRRNVRNSARAPGRRVARARGCSGCGVRAMHECRVVSPRHSHAVGRCNARSAVYAFVRASQLAQMAGCTRFHVIKRGWPGGVTQHRWTLSAARGTALEARLRRMAQRETTQGRISRVRENEAGAENYLRDRIWRSAKLTRVNPRRARSGRRCRNRAMPRTRGFARDAAMLPKDVPQLVHSRRQIVEYVDAGIDWERPRDARL